MTLKAHIDDIREGLEKRRYPNEAAVSQGIVLRLLNVLAWPTYDTQVVIPEYGVKRTRVDYALCHPPSKPIVFIEVKQVGNIEGAEEQLFRYASHEGVPIAILTDGQKWRFFHPMGQEYYKERKVHELDLTESDSEESVNRLDRYLNYESIRTGEAVKAIEDDYRKVSQQRQVKIRLPEAWSKLVEEADKCLLHAVAEKTEGLCGHRPTDEQVLNFLKSLDRKTELDMRASSSSPRRQNAPPTRLVVTMPNGEKIEQHYATRTFAAVLLKLIDMEGEERVIDADRERRCISTSAGNFKREAQHGKYYISTGHSTSKKKDLLERIAGRLGVQLRVEIVDRS